jgi:hypothetical protein
MRCTCTGDNEKMTCSYCDDRIDEMEWEAAGISDISGVDPIGAEDSRESSAPTVTSSASHRCTATRLSTRCRSATTASSQEHEGRS